ncbi:MAG: exodeoxyribonuclease VII small subunit [Halioglobus sp.]|nr:exodeoxyribonuclease VII small subunit [Halioglobus sp.]
MSRAKKKSVQDMLEALEGIVTRLEGDIPLEKARADFEDGIKRVKAAQKSLEDAEQRVQELLEEDGDIATRPFDEETPE